MDGGEAAALLGGPACLTFAAPIGGPAAPIVGFPRSPLRRRYRKPGPRPAPNRFLGTKNNPERVYQATGCCLSRASVGHLSHYRTPGCTETPPTAPNASQRTDRRTGRDTRLALSHQVGTLPKSLDSREPRRQDSSRFRRDAVARYLWPTHIVPIKEKR